MWIFLPAAYLLLTVLLHAWVARARPKGNRVRQYLAVGTAAGLALMFHVAVIASFGFATWTGVVLAYAFGCELYIFLFTFVTSSVSVALLLGKGDAGSSTLNPAEMVEQRLQTMRATGLLDHREERFLLNRRSRTVVTIYRTLRRFFRHAPPPGIIR